MSMTDPLADMLTRINNAQASEKEEVIFPKSKLKLSVCNVLLAEGYISGIKIVHLDGKPQIIIALKYYKGNAVIERLQRISKPGRRVYKSKDEIPSVLGGLGIAVISTSKGVMTDKMARVNGLGGEILCVAA
jgi:small subunit ribosomal protein S8